VEFVREALRTLKPNGKLVITPLFLTNVYAEIFNTRRIEHYDWSARTIVDRTSTFCGWGPHEGLARTYDVRSFLKRIHKEVPTSCRVELFAVSMDGKAVPDMRTNTHLALLNGSMRSLRITKIRLD
jgi:hypothetical protein